MNLTDGEKLFIQNADHRDKVTHFTWRSVSSVKSVPKVIFQAFPNMDICDLSIGIENLAPDSFENAGKIKTLVLIKNRIRAVPTGVFVHATNVETLQIEYNNIERIEDYAFRGMDSLLTVSLNVNDVTIIGRYTFVGAPNLQQIDITYNDIETIESGAFDLPKLKTLNLGSNSLKTLAIDLFDHAPLLTTIDVNGNNLNTVPAAFFGSNVIDHLDMSWNPMNDAKLSDFLKVKKLVTLSLQNVGIIWPTSTDNWDEPSESLLAELNLDFNKLSNPDILKFVSMFGRLEKLELSNCKLTHIKYINEFKERFPNITEVHVDYNEMDCEWVRDTVPILEAVEVELITGDDEDDYNAKKRERTADSRPCGKYASNVIV